MIARDFRRRSSARKTGKKQQTPTFRQERQLTKSVVGAPQRNKIDSAVIDDPQVTANAAAPSEYADRLDFDLDRLIDKLGSELQCEQEQSASGTAALDQNNWERLSTTIARQTKEPNGKSATEAGDKALPDAHEESEASLLAKKKQGTISKKDSLSDRQRRTLPSHGLHGDRRGD